MIQKTCGEVLANGILEVVGDEFHPDRLNLLLWMEGKLRIQPCFSLDAEFKSGSKTDARTITFEPAELNPTFARAIRFPFRPPRLDPVENCSMTFAE
jgi:hypothetical protein